MELRKNVYFLKLTEFVQQSEIYLSNIHTDTNIAFSKARMSLATKKHRHVLAYGSITKGLRDAYF
jgi:hypothetical protein